jgi:lipoate-protein ligase A
LADVYLLRGRASDPDTDRATTARMVDAAADGEAGVRAWSPHRQVAFGRRDARADGYAAARAAARERGFRPVERDVGGRAVAYDGGVVAVAHAVPVGGERDIAARYESATATLESALSSLGATVERGEPPNAFCPGQHSLRMSDGGKVAGVAQRVRRDAALVGCCVLVRTDPALVDAFDAVDAALDVPFARDSAGSVAAAGGPDDPEAVARALEAAFSPDPDRIERVD